MSAFPAARLQRAASTESSLRVYRAPGSRRIFLDQRFPFIERQTLRCMLLLDAVHILTRSENSEIGKLTPADFTWPNSRMPSTISDTRKKNFWYSIVPM